MKAVWFAALALTLGLLLMPQSAYALEDWCDRDAVGDTMCDWMDDTWGGSSTSGGGTVTTYCTKSYCPRCGLDSTQTKSVCYSLFGQSGYCSCQGTNYVGTDKYGNKFPRCSTSGSCRYQR